MASNKQIFYDTTGRRKRLINIALFVFLGFVLLSAGLISFSINRLNRLENIARNDVSLPKASAPAALLYTDNHERAYSVTSSQISKLKTILVPRYVATPNYIESPDYYKALNDDLEFMSENKSTSYGKFFILSSKKYTDLPLERRTNPAVDSRLYNLVNDLTMADIINDISKSHAQGLVVELDPTRITLQADVAATLIWLSKIEAELKSHNLKIGYIIDPSKDYAQYEKHLISSDLIYVTFDYSSGNKNRTYSYVPRLAAHSSAQIIAELPTVSSKLDFVDPDAYVKSVDYSSVQDHVLDRNLARSENPIPLKTNSSDFMINDAISAYNFARILNEHKTHGNAVSEIQFSIANPGYEEFSTWNMIASFNDSKKVNHVLSSQVQASQKIKQEGSGQIYKVENGGTPGQRSLAFNDSGIIISSEIKAKDVEAKVIKSGKKTNKISITFDDGPHPVATKKILDILDSNGVKGTFFALGEKIRDNPTVAREIVTRGHELENHSYNHPIFSKLDTQSQANQIDATNKIIKEVTGETARYFRKPYSDSVPIASSSEVDYLTILQQYGLLSSEYDIDSKDWELPTAEAVVNKVKHDLEASNGAYSQILMHDIHSRPEITYEALPQIIQYLKSKNIEIVRVDELVEQKPQVAGVTTTYQALRLKDGWASAVIYVNLAILSFALLKYAWMIFGTIIYHLHRLLHEKRMQKRLNKKRLPNIAVIIACYNEEKVIGKTLDALLSGTYKKFKIVAVNDGSKDGTLSILKKYASRHANITVIDIPNGGKAAALSLAIKKTRNKWLIFCDADTVFAPDALQRFALEAANDPGIGAIAGKINVGNDHNLLTRSQFIEYSISHYFMKTAQDLINSIIVVPGAAGLWKREALMKIGGFTSDTLAEDADATMKVIAAGYRVKYISGIGARTEAPEKVSQLMTQRTRWQLGNMQALFKHSRGLFNYRYRLLGYVGLPMFYIELIGAIFFPVLLLFTIAVIMYFAFGWALPVPAHLSFIASPSFVLISSSIILLELLTTSIAILRDAKSRSAAAKLFIMLPFYILVYKTILSYATLVSFLRALRGTLHGWGNLKRTASVQ